MRLLICGDRNWTDKEMIQHELAGAVLAHAETLVSTPPNQEIKFSTFTVIEGEARGADTLAREAAEFLHIRVERYPADWKRFGKRAGPMRNAQMIAEGQPDEVWAFHDHLSESRGTANMITQAKRAGIPVKVFSHA